MEKKLYLFAGVNGAGKSTLYNIIDKNINLKDILKEYEPYIFRVLGNTL